MNVLMIVGGVLVALLGLGGVQGSDPLIGAAMIIGGALLAAKGVRDRGRGKGRPPYSPPPPSR